MAGPQTAYQKWYEHNKLVHNARRRRKYATDKDYRAKQLTLGRNRRELEREETPPPEGMTAPELAVLVGRGVAAIRVWEQRKLIPKAKIVRGYRRYHPHHVKLLRELAAYMDENRTTRDKKNDVVLKKIVKHIKENW